MSVRTKLYEEKRNFKKLIRKKKRVYKKGVLHKMNLNKKNGKIFWKLLEKLDLNKTDKNFLTSIPMNKWTKHFRNILKGSKEPIYPYDCIDVGPLDFTITLEEMQDAAYILRTGKACGIDSISNEMLKCVLENKPETILYLLNALLEGKTSDVSTSLLTPIHKKGQRQTQNVIEEYL